MTYIGRKWFILAEFNFYWQNITSTGRIWLTLAEHDLYWPIVTLAGRIWLPLAEYDLYWLIFTLTGRICSQSKVYCRSALLCRFNIPKTEWWGAGVVICLEWRADLHMAQLMPLPLTVSCFNKIQIGLTFLVPAHLGSPGKRAVKRVCVCLLFFRCLLILCFLHFIPCCMCVCHWITYFLTYLQLVPASLCFFDCPSVDACVRACPGMPDRLAVEF